jgi:hypothetical protein
MGIVLTGRMGLSGLVRISGLGVRIGVRGGCVQILVHLVLDIKSVNLRFPYNS